MNSGRNQDEGIGVCIIVENCPLAADRRVRQEAFALKEAGYQVSVICPKGPGYEEHVIKEGIYIYPHATWVGSSVGGYLLEYGWALLAEFWLALRVYRRHRFRVLQACNPPDNIFLIALFFKVVFGVKFIFDHHDPSPELYETRMQKRGVLYWVLRLLERLTFWTADATIATNRSILEIATGRGKVRPEQAFMVRTCPDMERFRLPVPDAALKEGRERLVLYLGHMGPQDGLDLLLDSIYHLVHKEGRRDTLFALIGGGSELPWLRQRATELGLNAHVRFTGTLYGEGLLGYLAAADVGVAPDPLNGFNDQLTMLKIMEYMACGIPVVLYDLKEGRRTAGAAGLYARPNNPVDFAGQIRELLDSDALRQRLREAGKRRVGERLNWNLEKRSLEAAYQTALESRPQELATTHGLRSTAADVSDWRAGGD